MNPRTSLAPLRFPLLAAVLAGTLALAGASCRSLPPGAQTLSLAGEPLEPPPLEPEELQRRRDQLAQARAAHEADPQDAEATVWYGRRLAYLGLFREAVEVYGEGLREHPGDPWLWRHRGHRRITLRDFDGALSDLERAAELVRDRPDEVEPDGQPNAQGIPLETLKSNVFYHLGLALFLRGDFERALEAWRECERWSSNPDALCSVSHWLYVVLRRLGRDGEARAVLEPIRADLDVIAYHGYHRLLLFYRGELTLEELEDESGSVESATVGFGIAHWLLCEGREAEARERLRRLAAGEQWHAFGAIAAETELYGR
jgi:tetratricopeptide (TPR) repeat protein